MMTAAAANPFETLRLAPDCSDEEVVRQAGLLRQRATDEAALNAIRQAVQALTGRPEECLLHRLLTHPGPCYRWPTLERLLGAHRRLPLAGEAAPADALNLEEAALLLAADGAAEALWSCLLVDMGG
jgi:hypothetical protein